jgi:DNA-binding IclR family transcriptional regulator
MTGALIDRSFAVLELLARHPEGVGVTTIAGRLEIPASATHRLLSDLVRLGYVRQEKASSAYALTPKILSLSYAWFGERGAAATVQPALDHLARVSGELVRCAVVAHERLAWVAAAQGTRFGLRLEPDMGAEIPLYCTAAGYAWLASLSDEDALQLIMRQGFGRLVDDGPGAPRTIDALQNQLRQTRSRGWARAVESAAVGTSSLAVPVRDLATQAVWGILDISGPTARLGEARVTELSSALLAASANIAPLTSWAEASRVLQPRPTVPKQL